MKLPQHNSNWHRWLIVVIYAIAMAWVESAVVFYLRSMMNRIEPYQKDPFPIIEGFGWVELIREFSTVVMLFAVGALAGRTWRARMGYFAIGFGIWDIAYYVFLKCICGWPHTLLDWDVLFLLPMPWWGPVLAPVLISLLMIFWGTLASQFERNTLSNQRQLERELQNLCEKHHPGNASRPQDAGSVSPSPRFAESAEQNGERAGVRRLIPPFFTQTLQPASTRESQRALKRHECRAPEMSAWRAWVLNFAGVVLALYVFMADTLAAAPRGLKAVCSVLPEKFNWPLFVVALLLMAAPVIRSCRCFIREQRAAREFEGPIQDLDASTT